MSADLYPPSPVNVPASLTAPSESYKMRVVTVLVSLMTFVGLYIFLIAGTAYFSYWSFRHIGSEERPARTYTYGRPSRQKNDSGWWLVPGICSAIMCLFLVKGFFKRSRNDRSEHIEITQSEQPELFAFIRRLCQETRSPSPHKVYLSPEVNAAVFYHSSFIHLFWPARKNLLIGLGLVNRLNLSEFKAVLAHEFGHFSQSSMKLGTYVYTSNRIIGDLVYGRDWLDDVVAFLRSVDLRVAIVAWGFTGALWGLRKGLEGLFKAINFANSALSRQMEFNADLVAVSVAGSDAGPNGLARLDLANQALMQAWHDLMPAADHHLYSRDLFYHQTKAALFLRTKLKDPKLGEPPPLPDDPTQKSQVFQPGDDGVPRMWASHPSNYDREQNAKRIYLRVPLDERPAWVLFREDALVREKVTRRAYETARNLRDVELTDPESVQAFIDHEHAETTYQQRYQGIYDDRYVVPGDLAELMAAAATEFGDGAHLQTAYAALYSDELNARSAAYQQHSGERNLLQGLVSGSLAVKGNDFPFRDGRYRPNDAPRLLAQVEQEFKADQQWLNALDRRVFVIHYVMAKQIDDRSAGELEARYRFHLAVQEILGTLTNCQNRIQRCWAGSLANGSYQKKYFCPCAPQCNPHAKPWDKNCARPTSYRCRPSST